jgi:hypothetical protein
MRKTLSLISIRKLQRLSVGVYPIKLRRIRLDGAHERQWFCVGRVFEIKAGKWMSIGKASFRRVWFIQIKLQSRVTPTRIGSITLAKLARNHAHFVITQDDLHTVYFITVWRGLIAINYESKFRKPRIICRIWTAASARSPLLASGALRNTDHRGSC